MKILRRVAMLLVQLLLVVTWFSGAAQAALLDVGPTVPEVAGSTLPDIKLGYPRWYRDSNRVPLELCLNEAMCFYATPDPTKVGRFPDNIPDELFYWAAVSTITLPGVNQKALLDQAIEAAYSTGNVVPGAQIVFARMRIRIDTSVAGTYLVTTPFKQYTFNVTDAADGINFTEDIGIAEGGVFTGALAGSVGPFLYCSDAPFPAFDGSGGSYIGKNAELCPVLGSTFPDPLNPGQMANLFRIQGPPGFGGDPSGIVESRDFSVQGKIHTEVTPTPMTVDRVSYSRDASGMALHAFATTQALSNQTVTAPFPGNFALASVPSALQVTANGLPPLTLATNNPADGKFFGSSNQFPDPGNLPATVSVTNSGDTPLTVKEAPLVDEVVIDSAVFNPRTGTLTVSAASYDRVAAPALSVYMPGMEAPLGVLTDGKLSVSFPVSDSAVQPAKTFNVPPEKITVVSELGGSDTQPVTGISPFAVPTGSIEVNGGAALTNKAAVTLTLSATSPNPPVTQMQFSKNGVNFFALEPFASTRVATLLPGDGPKTMYVRYVDAAGRISPVFSAPITLDSTAPEGSVTINGGAASTNKTLVNLTLSAADARGVTQMQFSNDGINFFAPVPYATTATLNLLPGDGPKTIRARFIDEAGNVSAPVADSITLSSAPPTGSVIINAGAPLTNSANATLTLSATSPSGAVTQMQLSKDGVNYFAFEPYATTRAVTLLPGDGVRTIYVRFRDEIGNVSAPIAAEIVLDTTKPVGTITFTTPDPTTSASGTLALTALDAHGVTHMQFSRDGGVNYFPFEPFAASRTVTLALGQNTLSVRFKDGAGNVSAPVHAVITRN